MRQINTFTYPLVKFSGGRWYIEYKLNGKRKRQYYKVPGNARFYGEQLARVVHKKLKAENEGEGLRLHDAIAAALVQFVARPETVRAYNTGFLALKEYLPNMILVEVKRAHIVLALDKAAAARGWTVNTKKTYAKFWAALFAMLIQRGVLDINPAARLGLKSTESKKHVLLTSEEIEKIKSWCLTNSPRLWTVCQLVYYLGLRPAEVLRIKPENIKDNVLHLPASSTKNKKAVVRTLPPGILLEFFADHTAIYSRFEACRVGCDLRKEITVYSFRHTAAVRLYEESKDIKKVQAFLRHSNISITDNYLRNLGLDKKQDIEGLPAI